MKTEQIFDIYAIDYQKKFNENPVTEYQRKIIHDELKLLLSPGNEILDAGCGPGSDFEFYKLFNLKVSAFDFSLNMIRLAQKKAQELNLDANVFQSDIYEFCPDIKFDIIILNFGVLNALGVLFLLLGSNLTTYSADSLEQFGTRPNGVFLMLGIFLKISIIPLLAIWTCFRFLSLAKIGQDIISSHIKKKETDGFPILDQLRVEGEESFFEY